MQALSSSQIDSLASSVLGRGGNELLCLNRDGRVRYANPCACDRLGYPYDDLVTKSLSDYCPDQSEEVWNGHFTRTVAHGSDQIFTYHQDCSGNRYPVAVYSIPHTLPETEEQLICSLVKNAQNSERYQRMLETVEQTQRIGSFDFNLHDQSILASDHLLTIMGTRNPEDLKPAAMVERLSSEEAARWNSAMIGFINGHHRMDENFMVSTANNQQSLLRVVMWSTLTEGKVSGITGYYEVIDAPSEEKMISLEEAQRRHIIRALSYTKGRVTGPNGAERLLDINGKTLFARMKKLNINREDYTKRN